MIKSHLNKNFIMSADEEETFQLTNSCWICDKLFDIGDDKVRDHCHITAKYRVAAAWSCNNLKLSKFDVKLSVIPNGLEKYIALQLIPIWFFLIACNS